MWNWRRILTGWTATALALCVGTAHADQQLVSLTYRGTDVRKAISMLQTVSDLRVLVDPRVPPKRITVSFKDLSPEDALRAVVLVAGLSYRKVGNAFIVEPKDAAARAGAQKPPASAGGVAAPAPGLGGGIVDPKAPPAAPRAETALLEVPVSVAPEVMAALDRKVDVDVRNGSLDEVMQQLSRSAGIKVEAAPALSEGIVATVGLHGLSLQVALELVAEQTGLQISPRPEGVAFVQPGLSLEAAQLRLRKASVGARRVEQGQLWTAEWANVLTTGIAAGPVIPPRSLRRQPAHPDGRPVEFKPRSGDLRQRAPASGPAGSPPPAAEPEKRSTAPAPPAAPALREIQSSRRPPIVVCPHCTKTVPAKVSRKCAACSRALAATVSRCAACGGKPVRRLVPPAKCPHCKKSVGSGQWAAQTRPKSARPATP